jgi:hypothetical protein
MKNNRIEKTIYTAPSLEEDIKLASESLQEEDRLSEYGDMKYKEALDRFLEANPGKTEKDFKEMIIRIPLEGGGSAKIIKFSDYKDPAKKVKDIDLASLFTPGKTLASLSPSERAQVNMLLKLTLGKKD